MASRHAFEAQRGIPGGYCNVAGSSSSGYILHPAAATIPGWRPERNQAGKVKESFARAAAGQPRLPNTAARPPMWSMHAE